MTNQNNPDIFKLLTIEFGSLKQLAILLGVSYNAVYSWKMRGYQVPLKNLKRIEELSEGRITCKMMRPDVYDANV